MTGADHHPTGGHDQDPGDRRSARRRRAGLWVAALLLPELIANVTSNAFSGTTIGRVLQVHAGPILSAVVALLIAVWGGWWLYDRWRDRRHPPPEPSRPATLSEPRIRPSWFRFPLRLYGRDAEVSHAVGVVKARGVVAIVGPRDIGSSSIAHVVIERLLEDGLIGDGDPIERFDLRGNFSTEPAGARAIAASILSASRLDEPADDSTPVLDDAARRLLAEWRHRRLVLLLDNVARPEQVAWLTGPWLAGQRTPLLVIVGEDPVGDAVDEGCTVRVGELGPAAMREILREELGGRPTRAGPFGQLWRGFWGESREPVDELLAALHGRPRAVRDLARALRSSGQAGSLERLVRNMRSGQSGDVQDRLWTAILPHVRETLSPRATTLLYALTALPVTGLGRSVIDAMLTEESTVDDSPPVAGPDPLAELCERDLVRELRAGSYRLPLEVRRAVQRLYPGELDTPAVRAAVERLVGYYAGQATSRAAELRTANSAAAAIWLHQEEPLLLALLSAWPPSAPLSAGLVDDLAVVAAVLETWYVREQQSAGLLDTGRRLRDIALRVDRPELTQLAGIRIAPGHRMAGDLKAAERAIEAVEPTEHVFGHATSAALRARWRTQRGLIHYARAVSVRGDRAAAAEWLEAAEREFRHALAAVPENDGPGLVCALINLAGVALKQHRPGRATDHLREAETAAKVCGDASGLAQVIEFQGLVAERRGNTERAVALWQDACDRYRKLGEEQGEARCLQHLGRITARASGVAGPDQASELLRRSAELRAGQPKIGSVD